jgi:GDP-L-fucose synthase
VAGHEGLVGSAIVRELYRQGYRNVVTRHHQELELTIRPEVNRFFLSAKPDYVILAAAKVGGIGANSKSPAEFLYDNLQIQNNVIDSSYWYGVKKLLFLGSSCAYPLKSTEIKESDLLTGPLEPTNEAYALAKIAGVKMCQYYYEQYGFKSISLMPCNIYGPGDNFSTESSHVLASMLVKFSRAVTYGSPVVRLWGTGDPLREFLYVDDLARACVTSMGLPHDHGYVYNIGSTEEISITALAEKIARLTGFKGQVVWDHSKPDGAFRKKLDTSQTDIWFTPTVSLDEGLKKTLEWYKCNPGS